MIKKEDDEYGPVWNNTRILQIIIGGCVALIVMLVSGMITDWQWQVRNKDQSILVDVKELEDNFHKQAKLSAENSALLNSISRDIEEIKDSQKDFISRMRKLEKQVDRIETKQNLRR